MIDEPLPEEPEPTAAELAQAAEDERAARAARTTALVVAGATATGLLVYVLATRKKAKPKLQASETGWRAAARRRAEAR